VSARRFLLATRSEGKLRELREIFSEFNLDVVDLATLGIAKSAREDNLEAFDTFEDNALAKARYFYEASAGMPTFGDDSGMCVDALGGEPGVYSKRWSGREDLDGQALDAANNHFLGLPRSFWYGIVLAAIFWYGLQHTPLGRHLLFVGQNRDVSRLAGIRVDRIRLGAFVATGFLSALAGVILAGTLGAFQSSVASGQRFNLCGCFGQIAAEFDFLSAEHRAAF